MEAERQNPNLFCTNRRKDSAPPRVSTVHRFTPVPRERVGHPPDAKMWAWSSYRFYQYGEKSGCTPDVEAR
jgi:hypothetical protein